MIKLLFNLLIIAGFIYLLRQMFADKKPTKTVGGKPPRDPEAELLVEDPQCGVFVPVSTSVRGNNGQHFCSEECRKTWESKNG